jgi:hypothetical protein
MRQTLIEQGTIIMANLDPIAGENVSAVTGAPNPEPTLPVLPAEPNAEPEQELAVVVSMRPKRQRAVTLAITSRGKAPLRPLVELDAD